MHQSTPRKSRHDDLLPYLDHVSIVACSRKNFHADAAKRLLARHPHVLSRLRTEITNIAGLGSDAAQPSQTQLKKIMYLNAIIKQSMRLYPPVPVNARIATRATTLPVGGGPDGLSPILVQKGEVVSYSAYAMHRRKDIYGNDALDFKPERWEGGALENVGYGYLPFDAGPRNCLGQGLALLEMSYTIARLVQRRPYMSGPFDDVVSDVGKEKQILTMVSLCAEGYRVRFRAMGPEVGAEGTYRQL